MSSSPRSLRREVLGSFAVLFAGSILLACVGVLVAYPFLDTAAEAAFYLLVLLVGDLVVVYLFGRRLLEEQLARPVEQLVEDTERIAGGDFRHRVRLAETGELRTVGRSVNALANRLIRDQERLARNVKSLEESNRELVEARNEVTRAARLASAGSLAAGIAHEVGNPLGAIMSYVDVARKRAEAGRMDPMLLDSIREEAARIDRIVRGLLDYARPGGDGGTGPADPVEVVERVLELLDRQGRLDGTKLLWSHDEDVPRVHLDEHRLEHVIMNLILNSLDELEGQDGPWMSVRVEVEPGGASRMPIRRQGDPPGINYAHRRRAARDASESGLDPLWTAPTVVIVRVEDNGSGIATEDLDRIFDPFYTTKEPGRGTGLGLAIAARLVKGMGGFIDAGNRPEGGARFEVRLPGVAEIGHGEETP